VNAVGHRLEARAREDALRCPPPDAEVTSSQGGERRPRRAVPPAAEVARPSAPRRADQSPSMRIRSRGSNILKEYKGTVVAVTHDRLFPRQRREWILELDRGSDPLEGQLLLVLDQKNSSDSPSRRSRRRSAENVGARTRMDSDVPRARQSKGKAR